MAGVRREMAGSVVWSAAALVEMVAAAAALVELAAAALETAAWRRWRRGLLDEDEDELPDPGLLRIYIGADPLAPVRGWNRC